MATANNLGEGTSYGASVTPSSPPGTAPSNGGGTETYLAVFLAVVVVAVLVYTRGGGKLPGGELLDLNSVGDSVGRLLKGDGGGEVAPKTAARCPECGTEADGKFCPACGTEMVDPEGETSVSGCPGCGSETSPDDAFCGNCGEAL